MPRQVDVDDGDNTTKKPPKGFGTPHIYWNVATSGYEREGQIQANRTRKAFTRDKMMLERAPNACFGEVASDTQGKYLIEISPKKKETALQQVEQSMKETVMSVPDQTNEKCNEINARIHKDQLKLRRDLIKKELRQLEFDMSGGRAGYESNRREIGMRPFIEDEQGRMHGTLTRKPFVATDAIGTTSPQDFNAYNGTGLPEPDWGKHGMKSTLQKFPQLRSKSQLPRIPGIGFA